MPNQTMIAASSPSRVPGQSFHLSHRVSNWIGFLFFAGLAVYALYWHTGFGLALAPAIALETVVAISFLMRKPSRDVITTPAARIAAYIGTFLVFVFVPLVDALEPSLISRTTVASMQDVGLTLWALGSLMTVAALVSLRRSFSIEPAARQLVTTGLYRIARHPVYKGYALTYLGTWFMFPSPAFAMVLILWVIATKVRIHYEEQVLERTFPQEYAAYRRRVGILAPRLRPKASDSDGFSVPVR